MTADQADAPLFAALAWAAKQRTDEFNHQELVNTAWEVATADRADTPLFAALVSTAKQCMGELNMRTCQHGLGIYKSGPGGRTAVCSAGEDSKAIHRPCGV